MIRVAALYTLSKSSPYEEISGVDCWPRTRDALRYRGPWPVVAHPPCAPWSRAVRHQVHMSVEQGPHLAPAAVFLVRKYGGILEHPAGSLLWDKMSLPYPSPCRQRTIFGLQLDEWGGFTLEVEQWDWGHVAIKSTWLYMVGVSVDDVRLPPVRPRNQLSTDIRVSATTGTVRRRTGYELGSPEARKRTPPLFADWLVGLASTATGKGSSPVGCPCG